MATAPCEAAPIGHNNPPVDTPYDLFKEHIEDLTFEAKNYLDGKPIETAEQAAAVSRIVDEARNAKKDADAQRRIEAKPFDDGKAEVQARWTPLLVKADTAASVAKQALAPWLRKLELEKQREAELARQEAERLARIAQERLTAASGNLEAREDAERLLKAAGAAEKDAKRAEKAKAQVKGGERATGLRSVWKPHLTDSAAALRFYREREPEALKQWLVDQAEKDVRAGARNIPGFEVTEERIAV